MRPQNKKEKRRLRAPGLGMRLPAFLLAVVLLLSGCQSAPAPAEPTPEPQTGTETPPETTPRPVNETPNPLPPEVPRLRFSHGSGVYAEDEISVQIEAPDGYHIAYTTNGCTPTSADDSGQSVLTITLRAEGEGYLAGRGELMTHPDEAAILEDEELPRGCVLCASAVEASGEIFPPETRVFFLGTDFSERFPSCLVVSVYTDPENLLDYESGILATGAVFDAWSQTEEGRAALEVHDFWVYETNSTQKGREWERPCLVQIYDGSDRPAAERKAGMRVRGGVSRRYSQKSFNFYFRREYGSKYLDYELFEGVWKYKSFSLNAGGNSAEWMKFRESFLESMAADRDVGFLSSRMAVLFLNGEYWGPYLLTEKLSAQTLVDHYGVDPDQIVLIKNLEVEVGQEEDIALYEELMSYAEKDLADPEIYRQFCGIMDVRSMADYAALRIYVGDADWSTENNDVLWRSRDRSWNDGRWQYFLYDVEFSSGLYGISSTAADFNHFEMMLEKYPLLAAALRNEEFYALFLNALKEIGTVNYQPARVDRELKLWNSEWSPLLADYHRRYDVDPEHWKWDQFFTSYFFHRRYSFLIPRVEAWHRTGGAG